MEDHAAIAATILVQTAFSSDERLRTLLRQQTVKGPADHGEDATANFLAPWYRAMLKMVADTRA
jgi:hypothetical protein